MQGNSEISAIPDKKEAIKVLGFFEKESGGISMRRRLLAKNGKFEQQSG